MVDLRAHKVDSVRMSLTIVGKDEWRKLVTTLVCCATMLLSLQRESRHQGLQRVMLCFIQSVAPKVASEQRSKLAHSRQATIICSLRIHYPECSGP